MHVHCAHLSGRRKDSLRHLIVIPEAGMRQAVAICNGRRLALDVRICETFGERVRGLRGTLPPSSQCVLVINPCTAIHTFGMRYSIDVVFCRSDGRVLRVITHLKPRRAAWARRAACAWEFRAGATRRLGLAAGDRLTSILPMATGLRGGT
jgi:uncharacterized membrane protein (UPF0127 family)